MVREIKFRGVNAASRAVLEVDFVVDIDWMNDEVYFENGTDVATSIGSAKLMQYTGLKDKNGKEIYEGDILTLSNWTSNQYRKGNPITIYKVRIPGIFYEDCDEQIGKRDGEVIGNIYENPELLDNKQKGNK